MKNDFSMFFMGLASGIIPFSLLWPAEVTALFCCFHIMAFLARHIDYWQMTEEELWKYHAIERSQGMDIEWPIMPEIPAEKLLKIVN